MKLNILTYNSIVCSQKYGHKQPAAKAMSEAANCVYPQKYGHKQREWITSIGSGNCVYPQKYGHKQPMVSKPISLSHLNIIS